MSLGLREKDGGIAFAATLTLIINTVLYPYSRFAYESIVDFVIGNNMFFVNAIFMIFTKIITMLLCFGLAIFIAPLGLIYLYFYHSRNSN